MPNTAKLLERCRAAFDISDMTYDSLSEKSATARSTVVNYITGKVDNPKPYVVENIAKALGLDPDAPDPQEDKITLLTHCDRCRAAQNAHNIALREDFNVRHSEVKESYEQRIAELKEAHAREISMHEAERGRMQYRLRWVSFAFLALAFTVVIILAIDLLYGGVGWIRYSTFTGNHAIWDEVIQYVSDLMIKI